MAMIDPSQPIPLYFQLKTLLLESMLSGEYGPGDRIPTELELCELYGLSRTPVSRALSELAEEGVILRHRRRGTFVNPHWVPRRRSELRVLVPEEGPWDELVRGAAPDDLPINVVAVPRADLHHTFTHAVAEGQAPDLALLDSVWLAEFAAAGFLYALEDLDERWVKEEFESDFLPILIAASRYRGRTYSVPISANVAGLWYRRRPLRRLGLDPPSNWTELRRVAGALRAGGVEHPIAFPGGSKGAETTTYCLLAFLASNGVQVIDGDGVRLDQPGTVQALRFLHRLVREELLPAASVGYEWDRPVRLLARGRAVLSLGGSYEARTLSEHIGVDVDVLDRRVGFLPIPGGPGGGPSSLAGSLAYGITRQAAYPDLAFRLLQHLVAAEPLAALAASTGRIPGRRSVIGQVSGDNPLLDASIRLLEQAVIRPSTPDYPRVSSQLQAMLEAVLTGRLSPTKATRRAAEMIGAITGLPVVARDG